MTDDERRLAALGDQLVALRKAVEAIAASRRRRADRAATERAVSFYRAEIERRRGTGKRVLVPRELYDRVYRGEATPQEIAIARNVPPPPDDKPDPG